MLSTSTTKPTYQREIGSDSNLATFLPSPLLLQLVIENGWKVIRAELAPSEDQSEYVYLVTFRSDNRLQTQQLILPRTSLIEKILTEHSPMPIFPN